MRRSLALFAWGTGALFAFRWLRLRRRRPQPSGADPAEELRRKLEESRATSVEPGPPEPPSASEPEQAAPGTDDRRRDVHERGRAAIERMRERGDPPK